MSKEIDFIDKYYLSKGSPEKKETRRKQRLALMTIEQNLERILESGTLRRRSGKFNDYPIFEVRELTPNQRKRRKIELGIIKVKLTNN